MDVLRDPIWQFIAVIVAIVAASRQLIVHFLATTDRALWCRSNRQRIVQSSGGSDSP